MVDYLGVLDYLGTPGYLGAPLAFGGVQGGTSQEDQVQQVLTAATEVAGRITDPWRRSEILAQAARVHDLLTRDSDDLIWGPWGPKTCLEWGRYDAGLTQRANFRMTCLNWSDALKRALDKLADLLAPVDAGQAEAARSTAQQVETMEQGADIVPTLGDLWGNTSGWVKALLIGGGAVLALKLTTDLLQAVGALRQLIPPPRAVPRGFIQ